MRNFQLKVSQCERWHYVDIDYFIGPKFQRKPCRHPMLSTPCESVQICTDPDRYSRICRKLTNHIFGFEIEIS